MTTDKEAGRVERRKDQLRRQIFEVLHNIELPDGSWASRAWTSRAVDALLSYGALATAQAEQREPDRLPAGTHMSRQKTAEDYERINATAQAVTLTEAERTLIEGEMVAHLVTAFFDDGMDGRRVQRIALLAVKALRPVFDRLTQATAAGAQGGEGERT